MSTLRISHRGSPGAYVGLLKRGSEVVWACPHKHQNRDTDAAHSAARVCAGYVLSAFQDPDRVRRIVEAMRRATPTFRNETEARHYLWTIQRYEWALEAASTIKLAEEKTA